MKFPTFHSKQLRAKIKPKNKPINQPTNKQDGLIVILFVIMAPIILGVMAIALDAGQSFVVKSELQNAADACALSAAKELDGTNNQFALAESAGITVGTAHKANFQKTAVAMVANNAVRFAVNLNDGAGSYITAATGTGLSNAVAATYKYVSCDAAQNVNKFLNIPGLASTHTVSAKAIAGRVPAQSPCVLPIGVCSNATAVTTNGVGQWISGIVGKNNPCVGNTDCYKWVVYNGAVANAANLKALLTGNNSCGINLTSQPVTEFSGAAASPYADYNTRFGVQKSNNPVNPDFTGYGYTPAGGATPYPPAANAYRDDYSARRATLTKYQGSLPGYTVTQPTVANATARRIGVVPIIPCTGGTSNVTQFACVFMLNPIDSGGSNKTLYLEYLGRANAGACAQFSVAGGGGVNSPTVAALVQ